MSYYEQGYFKCNVFGGEGYGYDCYTSDGKKYNNTYPALCIVRYKGDNYDTYEYQMVSLKTGSRIAVDPNLSIRQNFQNAITNDDISKLYYWRDGNYGTTSGNYPDDNFTNMDVDVVNQCIDEYSSQWMKSYISDLPIFEITNTDMDGLNDYVDTGDDHGAINYSDLHPSKLDVDVWLDGTFPQMYIKPSMEFGDYDGNEISIEITESPILSPTVTLSSALTIDTMTTFSYDQYQNALPIVSTHYQLKITWGSNRCLSGFYINTSGIVTETTDGETDRINIYYHSGAPSDNDYPENNTNFDTTVTRNDYSGTNTLTKTYELDEVKLKQFGNFMWSSTFKDNVFSLLNSPLENIVSLKSMPLSGMGGDSENIKVGNVLSGISAPIVNRADCLETTVRTVDKDYVYIPKVFKNFIDYTEFSIKIYLPFIGFKELDAIAVIGRNLKLYYIWDCILGNVMAELYIQSDTGAMLLYDCWQGSAGIDIAISSTNRGQIESGYVSNGLSAITNLFSGNLAGVTKDVFSGLTQEFHSSSNGVGNPSLLGKMDMTARIIIKRPQDFKPSEYGHIVGYPCHKYMKIDDFSGSSSDGTPQNCFLKCKNFVVSQPHNSQIPYPTMLEEEKRELKELMESGVYV